MAVIIGGIVSAVISIGTVVYKIGKTVYEYIFKPINYVKGIIDKVRETIESAIRFIQDKLNYVIEVTKIDMFADVVRGIAQFTKLAEDIAKGHKESILKVLGGVYESIAGLGSDIIHFVTESLKPISSRIADIQKNIKTIIEFKISNLTKGFQELGEEIKEANRKLVDYFKEEIEKEVSEIKKITRGRFDELESKITIIGFQAEDVDHFTKMFLKMMER